MLSSINVSHRSARQTAEDVLPALLPLSYKVSNVTKIMDKDLSPLRRLFFFNQPRVTFTLLRYIDREILTRVYMYSTECVVVLTGVSSCLVAQASLLTN